MMKKAGFSSNDVKYVLKDVSKAINEEPLPVSISGMDKVYIPLITKDFPEFSVNELRTITENNLRAVFSAISNKDKTLVNDMPLVKQGLDKIIDDYRLNDIDEVFSDVVFNKITIKNYDKSDGVATIEVCASVGYHYSKKIKDKVICSSKYKKQTRYTCKFIYIYDETLLNKNQLAITINCPNCGAAITGLGHKKCEYCGSVVKDINLKAWTFSSYKEG